LYPIVKFACTACTAAMIEWSDKMVCYAIFVNYFRPSAAIQKLILMEKLAEYQKKTVSNDLEFCIFTALVISFFISSKSYHLVYIYPDGIQSRDHKLQSPRWQAETIPLCTKTTPPPGQVNIWLRF
jgi:hypothetical protein